MTYQDESARRLGQARGAAAGEGGDADKPFLFRGGDGGGGDAPASLASANGGGADGGDLEAQQRRSAERNHPNPSPEGEGLQDAVHGEEQTRHPELVSGPRAAKPEDGGKPGGIESGEHAPDTPVRLERSRETGDGNEMSRLRSTRTDMEAAPPRAPRSTQSSAPKARWWTDAQSSGSSPEHRA